MEILFWQVFHCLAQDSELFPVKDKKYTKAHEHSKMLFAAYVSGRISTMCAYSSGRICTMCAYD